MANLAWVC